MRTFAFGRGSNGRATAEDAEEDEAVDSELVEIGVIEIVAIVGATVRQAGAAKEAFDNYGSRCKFISSSQDIIAPSRLVSSSSD